MVRWNKSPVRDRETEAYWELRRVTNDKLEAIKESCPKGLPSSPMFFRSLFEYSDKGRILESDLAAALGTSVSISYDDFLDGFAEFVAAVETVYDDLFIKGKVKVLHDGLPGIGQRHKNAAAEVCSEF
jgi:hypothetical protein